MFFDIDIDIFDINIKNIDISIFWDISQKIF